MLSERSLKILLFLLFLAIVALSTTVVLNIDVTSPESILLVIFMMYSVITALTLFISLSELARFMTTPPLLRKKVTAKELFFENMSFGFYFALSMISACTFISTITYGVIPEHLLPIKFAVMNTAINFLIAFFVYKGIKAILVALNLMQKSDSIAATFRSLYKKQKAKQQIRNYHAKLQAKLRSITNINISSVLRREQKKILEKELKSYKTMLAFTYFLFGTGFILTPLFMHNAFMVQSIGSFLFLFIGSVLLFSLVILFYYRYYKEILNEIITLQARLETL